MDSKTYTEKTARTDLSDYKYETGPCERANDPEMMKVIHAVMGLSTEAGEALDAIKKHLMYGKPLDLVNLAEEFGDALWYIARGLNSIGFTIEQAMQMNINKLEKRFPEKFTEDEANTRNLTDEREQLENDFNSASSTIKE